MKLSAADKTISVSNTSADQDVVMLYRKSSD